MTFGIINETLRPPIRTAGKQTFSLDFDDTFTADPELWSFFVNKALTLGHKVYCVTARYDTDGNLQEIKQAIPGLTGIVMTGARPKRSHVLQQHDIEIDVWIDDCPEAIVGESERLQAAYNEVERMRLLVNETREQRDFAENKAKEAVQKEMAALRAEITRLKSART